MKKLLHIALLSALAFSFTPMKAAVTSARDLYGTWTFKAKVEILDNSFADKEAFSGDCEVTIGPTTTVYDCDVAGFAEATTTTQFNFHANNGQFGDFDCPVMDKLQWGNSGLVYASVDTISPYAGAMVPRKLTFFLDEEGTVMTLDSFYLVLTPDPKDAHSITPIAKFTECTLTLKEKQEVAATDMSGNWHFTGDEGYIPSENFPAEFDMTLETANEMNTLYKATMTFEGYEPVIFENVTFNDETMTFPINNTYVDQEKGIVFADGNTGALEGTFSFTKKSEKKMSVNFSIRVKEGETPDWAVFSGDVTKKTDDRDFTGTYTITSDTEQNFYVEEGRKTSFEVPAVSEMTIIDQSGALYITKIFGQDLGEFAIAATASGDTLTIPTTNNYPGFAVVYSNQGTCLVMSTESDKISGDIKFYWDEKDQTFKLDDMFLLYYEWGNNESIAMEAYINSCTAERKAEEEWNYLGDYTMNATVTTTAAAADYADFDFAESSKLTVGLWNGGEPTLISTFMNADAFTLNNGGFMVTVDEQAKTLSIAVETYAGGLLFSGNEGTKTLHLRDAEQGTNPLVITYNEDGTITMSDFTIVDKENNLVATCTNVTLTRGSGSDAIESVSSDRKAAVYAADGVIYIAGEPTRVEVYSISGAQAYSGITNEIGGLKRGFYLVKANGSTSKVIVR